MIKKGNIASWLGLGGRKSKGSSYPAQFSIYAQLLTTRELAPCYQELLELPSNLPLAIVAGPLSGKWLDLGFSTHASSTLLGEVRLSAGAGGFKRLEGLYYLEPGARAQFLGAIDLASRGGQIGFYFEVAYKPRSVYSPINGFEIVSSPPWWTSFGVEDVWMMPATDDTRRRMALEASLGLKPLWETGGELVFSERYVSS